MLAHMPRRRSLVLILLVLGTLVPAVYVQAFSVGQEASLVLGQSTFTANGHAVSANTLYLPQAVAVDPTTGKVFVADTWNNRVLRFAARANLSNGSAAEAVLGQPNFTSNTAFTTSAQGLNEPIGLAVDRSGRLWVADVYNYRVLRFDNAASKPSGAPADGVLGQPDFTSRVYGTSAQTMSFPYGVAVDDSGRLWVLELGNSRVLRFDSAASKPNGAPADGVLGQPGFTSRTAALSAQGMANPVGVAVDRSGRLWVGDWGNHRVLRFDNAASKPNGAPADGVLGQPNFTNREYATTVEGMNGPSGVAVDDSGRLWVADIYNNRVLWFDNAASKPNGEAADGVLGQPYFTSDTAATSAEGMAGPGGIAVEGDERLWVADGQNHRALLFETSGPPDRTPTPAPVAGLTRTDNPPQHSRCQYTPGQVPFSGTVRMPPGYQTATLQVSWYITSPSSKRTLPVYQMWTVQDGAQVSVPVPWPGIDPGDSLVHVYIGTILLNPLTLKPIPDTSRSFSEYWYPWVCPAPAAALTPTP